SNKLIAQHKIVNQGISAELIAEKWGLTREELDSFALKSHQLALDAMEAGRYQDEIVPIEVKDDEGKKHVFSVDEGPRKQTYMEALAQLQPVIQEDGDNKAGNASQLSDDA